MHTYIIHNMYIMYFRAVGLADWRLIMYNICVHILYVLGIGNLFYI